MARTTDQRGAILGFCLLLVLFTAVVTACGTSTSDETLAANPDVATSTEMSSAAPGEDATEDINWSPRVRNLFVENHPKGLTAIVTGDFEIEDPMNPLAILEYTHLKRLEAICTGDERILYDDVYNLEPGTEPNGLFLADLAEIDRRRQKTGEDRYLASYSCRGYGFSFKSDTLEDPVWSSGNSKLSVTIDQWSYDNGGEWRPVTYGFVSKNGRWLISYKDI